MNLEQNLFLDAILQGDRREASILLKQFNQDDKGVKSVYEDLIKPALYKVGNLWEYNRITVAEEHVATAVCEALMNELYPEIVSHTQLEKKAVISCLPNENHQVGAKMVADIFELNHWDTRFLGANTPLTELLRYIQKEKPDCVGLSLSVYFNFPILLNAVESIQSFFPEMEVFVGGQAFAHVQAQEIKQLKGIPVLRNLEEVQQFIKIKK